MKENFDIELFSSEFSMKNSEIQITFEHWKQCHEISEMISLFCSQRGF